MLCYSTGSLPDGIPLSRIAEILGPSPFRGVELVVTAEMLPRAGDEAHCYRAQNHECHQWK